MMNLEDYVSLVVAATVKTGISRQVEAFKSGFDEVCAGSPWKSCPSNLCRVTAGTRIIRIIMFSDLFNGGLILAEIYPSTLGFSRY